MIRAKWAVNPNSEIVNSRCSSLPPSTPHYEDHVSPMHMHRKDNNTSGFYSVAVDTRCLSPRFSAGSAKMTPTLMSSNSSAHSVLPLAVTNNHQTQSDNFSTSTGSMITDEDSGCGLTSSKQNGSTYSIANSGPVTSDDTGGSGIACRDELLHVMTEDLVEWFLHMYPNLTEDIDVENFYERLSDGVLICHHATEVHQRLSTYCTAVQKADRIQLTHLRVGGMQAMLPTTHPAYQTRGLQGSLASMGFVSRVNVSNFLVWCRQLGMPDSVLFESEDLVCRKNPRNVAICLLELARLGGRLGMAVPDLIQLEVEIDGEIAAQTQDNQYGQMNYTFSSLDECNPALHLRPPSEMPFGQTNKNEPVGDFSSNVGEDEDSFSRCHNTRGTDELRRLRMRRAALTKASRPSTKGDEDTGKKKPELKRPVVDMRSLDEIVRDLLSQCTCKQTFPMNRVGDGRYLFGDKCTQIFVRILRNHVMVRVGGGWDTLNHFLSKYDECRKINPPNCRVQPTRQVSVDTSSPDEILESISPSHSTSSTAHEVGPIRGEGNLNVVKRSPVKSPTAKVTGTTSRSDAPENKTSSTSCPSSNPVPTCGDTQILPGVTESLSSRHTEPVSKQISDHPCNTTSSIVDSTCKTLVSQPKPPSVDKRFVSNDFTGTSKSNLSGKSRSVKCAHVSNLLSKNSVSRNLSHESSRCESSCNLDDTPLKSADSCVTEKHTKPITQKTDFLHPISRRRSEQIQSPHLQIVHSSKPSLNRLVSPSPLGSNTRNSRSAAPSPTPDINRAKASKISNGTKQFQHTQSHVLKGSTTQPSEQPRECTSSTVLQNMQKHQRRSSLIPRPVRCNSTSRTPIRPCEDYVVSDL